MDNLSYLGNKNILASKKTAFLCSRRCPAAVVIKSYDWALGKRENGECVIIGNHSKIERDVFDILLKGKQPLILVLARGFYKKWDERIEKAITEKRLLVITSFNETVTRISENTALVRNKLIIELADEKFIAYAQKGGTLDKMMEMNKK
jgi:hypothetical protein